MLMSPRSAFFHRSASPISAFFHLPAATRKRVAVAADCRSTARLQRSTRNLEGYVVVEQRRRGFFVGLKVTLQAQTGRFQNRYLVLGGGPLLPNGTLHTMWGERVPFNVGPREFWARKNFVFSAASSGAAVCSEIEIDKEAAAPNVPTKQPSRCGEISRVRGQAGRLSFGHAAAGRLFLALRGLPTGRTNQLRTGQFFGRTTARSWLLSIQEESRDLQQSQ